MLHIRPGDDILPKLKAAGLPGEFVRWADALCLGPTPAGLTETEWRDVRAQFAAESGYLPYNEAIELLSEQDRNLDRFSDHDRVFLWFEHDLFCQMNLLYLLDWFSRRALGKTKLFLICAETHLGPLSGKELAQLYGTEHEVTPAEFDLARQAWRAFCSSDPTDLEALIREDLSVLPFLQGALVRHLQEFPSIGDGLGLTERLALEGIAYGLDRPDEIFREVNRREEVFWLGNTMFWPYLKRMGAGNVPLLRIEGDRPWPDRAVSLTETGRAVTQGDADWVKVNGVDRWLGGVHLIGEESPWRWDAQNRRLKRNGIDSI